MPWIERFGDLAAETGLSHHAGTTNRVPANDDWSKMKKKYGKFFSLTFAFFHS